MLPLHLARRYFRRVSGASEAGRHATGTIGSRSAHDEHLPAIAPWCQPGMDHCLCSLGERAIGCTPQLRKILRRRTCMVRFDIRKARRYREGGSWPAVGKTLGQSSSHLDPTIVPGDLAEQTNDMVNAFRHRLDALSWRDASPSSCFHHSGGSRTTCWRDDYPIETVTGSHHQDCDTGTRILEQACLKITWCVMLPCVMTVSGRCVVLLRVHQYARALSDSAGEMHDGVATPRRRARWSPLPSPVAQCRPWLLRCRTAPSLSRWSSLPCLP